MLETRDIAAGLSLIVLGALGSGQSHAADLPVKALPPAPAFVDWTGVYVGGHLGYGGGMKDWLTSSDFTASGGLIGGQVGFNKQLGSFVFGLEVDGSWADIKGSQSIVLGGPAVNFESDGRFSSRIDGILTVAPRIGLAADRWLIFAKGGLAAVHERHDVLATIPIPAPVTTVQESGTETRIGAMLGLGAEYALAGNWSLKGEYDYLHLSGQNVTLNGSVSQAGVTTPIATPLSIEQAIHLVKFGANYRFGAISPEPHFAPVPPARGTNWTGAYLGAQGGYGFERETWPDFLDPTMPASGNLRADSWLAGFNGGVNAQAGSFVFGVEGEWMWTGLKPSQTVVTVTPPLPVIQTQTLSTAIDWLAIASAKAGFVVGDKLLIYGRGGVAIAQEKHAVTIRQEAAGFGFAEAAFASKAVHTGGVIGAGAEYALGNNWSAKVEYDYIKMLGQNATGTGTETFAVGPVVTFSDFANFSKMAQDLQLVKVGVNYRFAAQPAVVTARY